MRIGSRVACRRLPWSERPLEFQVFDKNGTVARPADPGTEALHRFSLAAIGPLGTVPWLPDTFAATKELLDQLSVN